MEQLNLRILLQHALGISNGGNSLKLNIGCGGRYKKGYVNIDAFDTTVADQKMSVVDLEYDDDTFTHADCIQVIEHLGAAKSIYALSEIYRVLKPGGILVLETPDLVRSFKSFIKTNEEQRKLIMNWIYGLDSPGMSHRYGFPEDLIQQVLSEAGFEQIRINYRDSDSVNPTIQVTCHKRESKAHQIISHFRRKLVVEDVINLQEQVEVLDLEVLIHDLLKTLLTIGSALTVGHQRHILEVSALFSPKIGHIFFEMMMGSELIGVEDVQKHLEILGQLQVIGFVRILIHLFEEMPLNPGKQKESFETFESMMKQTVNKVYSGDRTIIENLTRMKNQTRNDQQIEYFTIGVLERLAEEALARGIKSFALNQLEDAESHLLYAIRMNHDLTIAYWNIARVFAQRGKIERAITCYSTVIDLVRVQYLKRGRELQKRIEYEIQLVREGRHKMFDEPLLSLR